MDLTWVYILGIIVGVVFLELACVGFVKAMDVRKKHVDDIKRGVATNNKPKLRAYVYLVIASIVGGIGLVVFLHNVYTVLEINNLILRSAFASADMFAAILTLISIIVGVLIFFVQDLNSELMELESTKATDRLNKYYQSVFELNILREQNQLRQDLAVAFNSLYDGIVLEIIQGESNATLYFETNEISYAKNFVFPEKVNCSVENDNNTNKDCAFVTSNQRRFQLNTDSNDVFADVYASILNGNEVTLQLSLDNVSCKNLKIPVKDTNSEDLGAFIEKDCKFTLKQRITVKYAYENENEQVYFDILKIQSDIEYKI